MFTLKAFKSILLVTFVTFTLALGASTEQCPKTETTNKCVEAADQTMTWWQKMLSFEFKQFHLFDLIEFVKRDNGDHRDFRDKGSNLSI